MNLKRILCALLCVIMLFGLVACGGEEPETPDGTEGAQGSENAGSNTENSTDEGTDTENTVAGFLDIVKDGKVADVVYSLSADSYVLQISNDIVGAISRNTGANTTRPVSESNYDPDKVEILVGRTSYPESRAVYERVGYGESLVCVEGNKLVIAGFNESAVKRAGNNFIVAMSRNVDENKNIRIPRDFVSTVADNDLISQVPVFNGVDPSAEGMGSGSYKLLFRGVNEASVGEYLAKFNERGFTKYTENKLDNNEFATYYNEKVIVNTAYTPYNSTLTVSVDSKSYSTLPKTEAENVYTKDVCSTTITQVGLYYDNVQAEMNMQYFNGMCYVIRLEDGSFILIDGGHAAIQADHLYQVLVEQAKDAGVDEIVIAAWFFSHNHNDHIGFFTEFGGRYGSEVKVEQVIFNFPFSTSGFDGTLKNHLGNPAVVKAHPGQKFYIRNTEVDMLYTADLYTTTSVADMADTNNASIVWRMEIEGMTFMSLGDYSEYGTTLMNLYSKSFLKTDIVQVAHHGISGMTNTLYNEYIRPTYAFWPVAAFHVYWKETNRQVDIHLDKRSENAYLMTLYNDNRAWLAKDDVVIMTLEGSAVKGVVTYENVSAYIAS